MPESNDVTRTYNTRSRMITEGDVRAPNRAMLRAVGLTDEDFNKPLVGIASTWSEITPCTRWRWSAPNFWYHYYQ
jgi:dihydroxy-acid dehydratase